MNNVKSFTKNIKEYKITRIKNLQKKTRLKISVQDREASLW